VAGQLGVGYVAMHRRGDSRTMQDNPTYVDVVGEVSDALEETAQRARECGVTRLWLDPGIGFGKTTAHNLSLLGRCDHFVALARRYGAGVLVGASRKPVPGRPGRDVARRRRAARGIDRVRGVGPARRCQYGSST
jgi:dihydropteroate synthase